MTPSSPQNRPSATSSNTLSNSLSNSLSNTAKKDAIRGEDLGIYKVIGANLRRYRQDRNWTQTEVASHLGLSYQQIQKYERGLDRIPAGRLYMMACLYNRSFCDIYPLRHNVETIDKL